MSDEDQEGATLQLLAQEEQTEALNYSGLDNLNL